MDAFTLKIMMLLAVKWEAGTMAMHSMYAFMLADPEKGCKACAADFNQG